MINKISLKSSMLVVLSILLSSTSIGTIANTAPVWHYISEPEIEEITIFSVNDNPGDTLNTADINSDGNLDIVVSYNLNSYSSSSAEIAWYELDKSWIKNTIIVKEGDKVESIAIADMDGDGDLDVLTASSAFNSIYWYENGNEWAELLIFSGIGKPSFITTADMDKDGDLDVIAASTEENAIYWYENGKAWNKSTVTTNVDEPSDVIVTDIDGDGDLDILSASYNDDKVALFENGNEWAETIVTLAANGVNDIEVTDIDGDGDLDIVSSSFLDDKVAWYDNGNSWSEVVITTHTDGAMNITISDIDGDGDFDVLATAHNGDMFAWYANVNGLTWEEYIITDEHYIAYDAITVDMDGDGDQDVLSLSQIGYSTIQSFTWFKFEGYDTTIPLYLEVLEEGTDIVLPITAYDADADTLTYSLTGTDSALFKISTSGVISFISASDYYLRSDSDKDNVFELILTVSDGVSSASKDINIKLLLGEDSDNDGVTDAKEILDGTDPNDYDSKLDTDGDGVPDRLEPYYGGDSNTPDAIDSDGDGISDYVEQYYGENDKPIWLAKNASGEHWKVTDIPLFEHRRVEPVAAVIDVTGDGIKDILSASKYSVKILDGANGFASITVEDKSNTNYSYDSITAADLTNDGINNLDIIVSENGYGIYWYEHDTWLKRPITDSGIYGEIEVYDMDSDGDLDIVAQHDYQILWYENGNTWKEHVIIEQENYISQFELVDFDLDGDIDIVATFQNISRVSWFENDHGWQENIITTSIQKPNGFVLMDIDGNGSLDILVTSSSGGLTLLKKNNGWQESKLDFFYDYQVSSDVAVSDMNNDGLLDIVCINASSLVWFNATNNWSKTTINNRGFKTIIVEDIDNDNDMDVVTVNDESYSDRGFYINVNTKQVTRYSIEVPDLSSEIKLPFAALDPDGKDLTYSLDDSDANHFKVDSGGILTFASQLSVGTPVDFDGDNIFNLRIIANDGFHDSAVYLTLTLIKSVDTDSDGILDPYDIDDDNDLVPDTVEIAEGTDPLDANSFLDEDKNGVPDFVQKSESLFINYQFPLGISINEGGFSSVDLSNVTSENGPVSIEVSKEQGLNYKFRDNVLYIYADYVDSNQTVNIYITLSDGVEVVKHVFPVHVKDVPSNVGRIELMREAQVMNEGLRLQVATTNIGTNLNYKWYIDGELLISEHSQIFTVRAHHFQQEDIVIKAQVSDANFLFVYSDGIELNRTSFLAEIEQSHWQEQQSESEFMSENVAGSTSLISLVFAISLLLLRRLKLKLISHRQIFSKVKLLLTSLMIFVTTACSSTAETKYELSPELTAATQTVNISLDESDPLYIAKLEYEAEKVRVKLEYEAEKERVKLERVALELERQANERNERAHISTIGF